MGVKAMTDQIFQPGDKVMRVAYSREIGLTSFNPHPSGATPKGVVFCVEECWKPPAAPCHAASFVGIANSIGPNGRRGWPTPCFRKVDEIRLCIEAVKKADVSQKVPA